MKLPVTKPFVLVTWVALCFAAVAKPVMSEEVSHGDRVEVYPCDPSTVIETTNIYKGKLVTMCVEVIGNEFRTEGSYIESLDFFYWSKDDNEDFIERVVEDGEVSDDQFTALKCFSGASVCTVQSKLDDQNYMSAEEITGSVTVCLNTKFGIECHEIVKVFQLMEEPSIA